MTSSFVVVYKYLCVKFKFKLLTYCHLAKCVDSYGCLTCKQSWCWRLRVISFIHNSKNPHSYQMQTPIRSLKNLQQTTTPDSLVDSCKTCNKFVSSQIIYMYHLMQNLKRNLLVVKIPICSISGKSGRIEKPLKTQFWETNTNANTTQ